MLDKSETPNYSVVLILFHLCYQAKYATKIVTKT